MKRSLAMLLCALAAFPLAAVDLDESGSALDPSGVAKPVAKDTFKAVTDPSFLPLDQAVAKGAVAYLKDDSWLFLVTVDGESHLYPKDLMLWHEIANDQFKKQPVGISYCVLAGSCVAFSSKVPGRTKSFGVSGVLYNSTTVMYDKQTGSLWPQLTLKAASGVEKGNQLEFLPVTWVTFAYAKKALSKVPILLGNAQDTETPKKYGTLPGKKLETYDHDDAILLPVKPAALENKTFGVKEFFFYFPAENVAIPFKSVEAHPEYFQVVKDGGTIGQIAPLKGKAFVSMYWFALQAYYPTAKIVQ
jgi:hypothetical protein